MLRFIIVSDIRRLGRHLYGVMLFECFAHVGVWVSLLMCCLLTCVTCAVLLTSTVTCTARLMVPVQLGLSKKAGMSGKVGMCENAGILQKARTEKAGMPHPSFIYRRYFGEVSIVSQLYLLNGRMHAGTLNCKSVVNLSIIPSSSQNNSSHACVCDFHI